MVGPEKLTVPVTAELLAALTAYLRIEGDITENEQVDKVFRAFDAEDMVTVGAIVVGVKG